MDLGITYSKVTFKSGFVLENYEFLGSALRGVFGVGLKKAVCLNPSGECEGCFANEGCVFYDFFEKKFPKYRIRLDEGSVLDFDVYLFEEHAKSAPYVIRGIHKAFGEIGITGRKYRPEFRLYFNDRLVYDGKFLNLKNSSLNYVPQEYKKDIKIFFKTPLRIKDRSVILRNDLDVNVLLRNIWHRYRKLKNMEIIKLPFNPEYKIKEKALTFKEFKRYSNRQKSGMLLGGLLGYISAEVDKNTYYLLKIAEIIGAGKQVTFGLGNIKII